MLLFRALYVMMLVGSLGLSPENAADRSRDILVYAQQGVVQIGEDLEAASIFGANKNGPSWIGTGANGCYCPP
jgi:hypothetical protein